MLTALVKMSFFFCIFHFLKFPKCSEMLVDRSPKFKILQNMKATKTKNNNNKKTRYKAKEIKHDDSKQNKTTSRKR